MRHPHKRSAKPGYSWHHMIPRSRGGTSDPKNLREIPIATHEAFHVLFKNMLPNEIVALLLSDQFQFGYENGLWRAWKVVFGPATGRLEAAHIIMDEWTPQ